MTTFIGCLRCSPWWMGMFSSVVSRSPPPQSLQCGALVREKPSGQNYVSPFIMRVCVCDSMSLPHDLSMSNDFSRFRDGVNI